MPAYARCEIVDEINVGAYHCVSRCVRRAFLCGQDPLNGQNYGHRKDWLQDGMENLAGIFAIDVLGFSVMSNHLHVVLRNRPDLAAEWNDEEVERRWWRLHPLRRNEDGSPAEPNADVGQAPPELSPPSARASNRGFLPLSLDDYLALLDWTGRQVRLDKRGAIPADLLPILKRLAINAETWLDTVTSFGRWFHRAVGRTASMAARASRSGKQWFQGTSFSRLAFD